MTFLNPLALFGLLAAALPILLHLLNLRKLRTVEFSTLAFLKELQKTRIRRLKLRQILLLILRTLLILLLVIAFARPTMRGTLIGNLGTHARTSAVFIIDDSYSMTVSNEQGELLNQARQAAESINHLFAEGDEIYLVRLSASATTAPGYDIATRDFALLKKNIDEIGPSPIRRSLEDGLRIASRFLATTRNFNKEVYIFSDFQQGVLTDSPGEAVTKEKLFPPEVRFFFLPVNKRSVQNFGVESITIPSALLERDKPFVIQAQIGNFSDNSVQDHVVGVFLNGTRVAERSIDLPKRSSVPVEFSVTAGAVGYVQGFVEIEDDDFPYDNRRYFVLQIPDQIRVLLVGEARDVQYPRLALATRASETESALTLSDISPDRLNSTMIRRADVIILCTSQGFSSSQISELRTFVNDGGGLAIFPGVQFDASGFNAQFAGGLSLPQCLGVDRSSAARAEIGSYTEFDKVELRHPIFEGMFESPSTPLSTRSPASTPGEARKVESPRILSSARFALTAQSNPIITLSNGGSFLTEHTIGSGRLFLFAVPTTTEWSDFPLKGLFVPMMHRTALYLGHQQARSGDVLPGSEIVLRSNAVTSDLWTIRNPQNVEVTAAPSRQSIQRVLRFAATDQLGLYEVASNTTVLQKFVVNLDTRESHMEKATPAEMDNLLKRLGIDGGTVHTIRQTTDLERSVLESRFGVELWKYFLMLALVVALIELLVARTTKREIGAGA
ncbi:MAG: BatA domain-containing protein [Ignavibacteriales bacterium]|nr:BatA domain-containing protein [Ignavibacteriales bacterium]